MLGLMKFCARILSKILFLLPGWAVRGFAWALAILWFDILRIRRRIVLQNLDLAFPHQSFAWKKSIARKSLVHQSQYLFELLYLSRIDQKWMDQNVIFEGEENVREALGRGKGVLGLSMHIGNGDLGSNMITLRGYPMTIITKYFKNQVLNDFWFALRGPKGVKYIEPHGRQTAFDIFKSLKRNEIVVFVLDQFMGRPFGVETTFFGHATGTAYGLGLFYLKTRAPVMPVYCFEEKDHKIRVVFGKILDLEKFVTEDQDKTVQKLTQYFTDIIEGVVREHPEQWMWLHRRWKQIE